MPLVAMASRTPLIWMKRSALLDALRIQNCVCDLSFFPVISERWVCRFSFQMCNKSVAENSSFHFFSAF